MKDNNTLSGFHIRSKSGEALKLHPKKYIWHIPKKIKRVRYSTRRYCRYWKTESTYFGGGSFLGGYRGYRKIL